MGYHLKSAAAGLWREKWINFISTLSIATGLFLIALAVLVVYNIEGAAGRLPERFSITVYLDDGLSADEVQHISGEIRGRPGVKGVEYTSKDEALAELGAAMSDASFILEGLEENPLPASLNVSLDRNSVADESVEALAETIRGLEGVEDVEYGRKLLEVIEGARRGVKIIGGLLVTALSAALVFVCYTTVKILFYRKKEEVETLTLLGATRGFIRAPFLIEGSLIGLGGGLLGAAAVGAVAVAAYARLEASLPLLGSLSMPLEVLYGLPAAGFGLGLIGSFIAIGRIKF
ncbi:MAG: permease-like cell division protein FtsX [Nitrospirota bacterium]|jgi:cell division transport system permease protein